MSVTTPVVLTKNDVLLEAHTRTGSRYVLRVPYGAPDNKAQATGGAFGFEPTDVRLPAYLSAIVRMARANEVGQAILALTDTLMGHHLNLPGYVSTTTVVWCDVAVQPKQTKVVISSTPEDDEPMPRDLAVAFVHHPRGLGLVPLMDLRCICLAVVDVTQPGYDLDRIHGNSNNGYQAIHRACAASYEGIKVAAWPLRVSEYTESGKVVEVHLSRTERDMQERIEGLLNYGWSLVDAIDVTRQYATKNDETVADEFWVYMAH